MTVELLTMVVITVTGFVLAFLFTRVINNLDESIKEQNANFNKAMTEQSIALRDSNIQTQAAIQKTNDVIHDLSRSMDKLAGAITALEKESLNNKQDLLLRIGEHHEEIELCRSRIHTLFNQVQAIRMLGQVKNGWDFKNDLEIPQVPSPMSRTPNK